MAQLASAQEQGLENFDASAWFGFFFPKATSDAIVQKLHDATVVAMNSPSVQNRLRDMGVALVAPERRSPEYLQEFVESEIQKWAVVINKANINTQ